jgi:hypothetical protein
VVVGRAKKRPIQEVTSIGRHHFILRVQECTSSTRLLYVTLCLERDNDVDLKPVIHPEKLTGISDWRTIFNKVALEMIIIL